MKTKQLRFLMGLVHFCGDHPDTIFQLDVAFNSLPVSIKHLCSRLYDDEFTQGC